MLLVQLLHKIGGFPRRELKVACEGATCKLWGQKSHIKIMHNPELCTVRLVAALLDLKWSR